MWGVEKAVRGWRNELHFPALGLGQPTARRPDQAWTLLKYSKISFQRSTPVE